MEIMSEIRINNLENVVFKLIDSLEDYFNPIMYQDNVALVCLFKKLKKQIGIIQELKGSQLKESQPNHS